MANLYDYDEDINNEYNNEECNFGVVRWNHLPWPVIRVR